MKWVLRFALIALIALGLSACGGSKFKRYNGPEVTRIEVHKGDRRMYLLHNSEILEIYDISLGFQPVGHKQFEGDGKTPEGSYRISYKNPRSRYHLSLGVSYPDENDYNYAKSQGKEPGGDIMIHGYTGYKGKYKGDWTAGCIAVTNKEIERIYSMVKPGTPILIMP
ncbi:L,D-transpeptidase family protein [Tabrizicola sp. J26]|uniref:L,D-transpeptidase family protein n=1 Tax=Alitabrizicola rongguiensis TaxID=2909234 RepID=UPI001F0296C6|nr:L,D-transpeptidase family protein [Tabrizicola rongguiensis]MCF1708172.1 L,D-transpeptidase family protein [Tabrizicola rongguiensis]